MAGLPPVICSICTELFVFSNQHEATQLIGSAPCGHTFHLNCLNQWLVSSRTCPQCRTSTNKKNAIRLFFDISTSTEGDAASQMATLADSTISRLNSKVSALDDQLQAKSLALEKARSEASRLADQLSSSKNTCSKVKASLDEERSKNGILRQRFDELTTKSGRVDELLKKNDSLSRKIAMMNAVEKAAVDDCENELEQLLHPRSGQTPDMRDVMTWLAVTSRELRSAKTRVKTNSEEAKKLRDRLATEKVRASTLSDELRKRNDELTRCENELKSAEERLNKQQAELSKYRVAGFKASGDGVSTPDQQAKSVQSASSACRDIFESPEFCNVSFSTKKSNDENAIGNSKVSGESEVKKFRPNDIAVSAFKEASPITPSSVTEFRKMATRALRGATAAPVIPPPLLPPQNSAVATSGNAIGPLPVRRGYNGLGGHSMTFSFPTKTNQNQNKPANKLKQSVLSFGTQPTTKRKL